MFESPKGRVIDGTVFASLGGDEATEADRRKRALMIAVHELCSCDYKPYRYITDVDVPGNPVKYILWDSDDKCPVFVWENLFSVNEMNLGFEVSIDTLKDKLDDVLDYTDKFSPTTDEMHEKIGELLDAVPDGHFFAWIQALGFTIHVANVINFGEGVGYSVNMGVCAGIQNHEERDEEFADAVDKYMAADIFIQDVKFIGALGEE